jgi:TRAP-type C4-dicarboxylate transport system substrate-binding protein
MKKTLLFLALLFAASAHAQPVSLKFNSPAPPRSFLHDGAFTPWAKAVEQDSGGTLKVEMFFGGTLGNFVVTYDRVVDGVADIGFILTALAGGKFKQQDVAALPFESKSSLAASQALWSLFEKGVTAAEFDAVKPLGIWTFPNAALNSKSPVKTLDDVKGKKITVSNAIAARTVGALGAAAVTMRPDEVYQALSRGIADMALMPYTGVATFKIHEVARQHLDVALGSDSAMVFISRKKWDSLPPQAKAAIDKHSYLPFSHILGKAADGEWARSRAMLQSTITLSAAEEAQWRKLVAPVAEQWTRDTPNGAKVLEAFRAEIAAFEAKSKGR